MSQPGAVTAGSENEKAGAGPASVTRIEIYLLYTTFRLGGQGQHLAERISLATVVRLRNDAEVVLHVQATNITAFERNYVVNAMFDATLLCFLSRSAINRTDF